MSELEQKRQELLERVKKDFDETVEFKHKTYSLSAVVEYDFSEVRYRKKHWVPDWLFRWFAAPDMLDLMDRKIRETRERARRQMMDALHEPGAWTKSPIPGDDYTEIDDDKQRAKSAKHE